VDIVHILTGETEADGAANVEMLEEFEMELGWEGVEADRHFGGV
jgi:hypothetical protein